MVMMKMTFLSWNISNISILYIESIIKLQVPIIQMVSLGLHTPSYDDVFTVERGLFSVIFRNPFILQ